MCKNGVSPVGPSSRSPRLLLTTLESYSRDGKDGGPLPIELITTCLIFVCGLVMVEYSLSSLFNFFQVRVLRG